ncbi:MAG: hypothetical protein HFH35_04875 [Eubacterium sp.]|nr:hypothetical protein [Eubacterium sp.]
MDNNYIPTAFDEKIQSKNLQILKTALPYMNGPRQKEILTLIKSMELRRSIELINSDDTSLSICSSDNPMENTLNMLNDIRKFCSDREQEQIDLMVNMFSMFSTYETMFS